MRFPTEKDNGLALFLCPRHLRQHPLFRAFHHFKPLEAKSVALNHFKDQAVAVISRLNTVNLSFQRLFMGGDIGKILDAKIGCGLVYGQRVFRPFKVCADCVHGFGVAVAGNVAFHRWHPIAKEDVDISFCHRSVSHRNRQHFDVGLIAECAQDGGGRSSGGGDIRPADIRERNLVTLRVGGQGGDKGKCGQRFAKGHGNLLNRFTLVSLLLIDESTKNIQA